MRAVVQRVQRGAVDVDGTPVGEIGRGFVVLLGVGREDNEDDVRYLAEKIVALRVFEDRDGKMNLALGDVGGALLVVSQFTLYGDCRKGRRPGFSAAAPPGQAEMLYESFCRYCEGLGFAVARGRFGAHMVVEIVNDGPVTLLLDSRRAF
ncbi:MAG: D-aminoacyl-tRNA deacylase [Bacillota bacterium]|nr:D-aminoacyl-tRNA deacylase [Bacillota bacterium]